MQAAVEQLAKFDPVINPKTAISLGPTRVEMVTMQPLHARSLDRARVGR
jgi:hypothetical protein